jgi:phytoene dehydrogenase-like protein
MRYDAIVIGAGSNGLTAATVLAKRGRKVLVVESAAEIGGMRRAIEFAPGFRAPLDADPGWVPPAVEKVIGTPSSARRAPEGPGISRPLASTSGDAQRYQELVAQLARFARVLGALYQLTPPDIDTTSPGEILPLLGVALKTRALGRKDMIEFLRVMPMSIQDLADDTLKDESLKMLLASAAVRDLRQGPRSAGTTFNLIHHMIGAAPGTVRRVDELPGGPASFARAAAEAARAAGVELRLSTRVERISVKDDAVTGVVLAGGEEVACTVVISTADPKRTLLKLVDPVWLDPELMLAVKNIKMRGCAAFVLYGVAEDLKEHRLVRTLTPSTVALEKAADAAKYGEISGHPHVEFFSPSARYEKLAPAGKSVLVARVQYAPYALKSGQWDRANADALATKVTSAIDTAIAGFGAKVEHRMVLTPRDLETQFGVTEGALTHGELTLDQILFMRPVPGWGHYEMPVRGLFLGGAGAHPGPGILGGAGLLAAKAALRR